MSTKLLTIAMLLLASTAGNTADTQPSAPLDTTAAWSRLKSLVGEWDGDTAMGKMHLSYTLTAGGTALVERESSEHMPEMLTVYYMDGKRLLLTHYCMAGNQPRMEARAFNPSTGEIQFQFLDITNLANPAGGHMRNASLRFVDDRHVAQNWQFYENGELKMAEKSQFTRVR